MSRAKSTSVTKVYDGDLDVGNTNFWGVMQEIAFLVILGGIGYAVVNWL